MFKKITQKYIRHIFGYFKLVLKKVPILMEHPFFYFKEVLNIANSLTSSILVQFPNFKLNCIDRKINGVNFKCYFDFAPRYRSMFFGLNSIPVIRVVLKYVKKGTCFIDVGANVGYISAVAASLVRKKGQVHSFEPVPRYFNKLRGFARLNKDYNININQYALGEEIRTSNINIYINKQLIGSNSLLSGLMNPNLVKETIEIEIKRLDDYLFERQIDKISLIKIDVEGFELPVLKGLTRFFDKNRNSLPPLIIEVTPAAYPLLGRTLEELDDFMSQYNYQTYNFSEKYRIDIKKLNKMENVLFKQKEEK